MLTNLYFPELLSGLLTFHGNFESFIKPESNLTEKELKESAARFVASIIIVAERMNRPWYLRLKDWRPRKASKQLQ